MSKNKVDKRLATAFGTALRKTRKRLQVTQEELAEAAGFHRTYIGFLEQGRRQPSLKVVFDLARGLGLPPSYLVREVEQAYFGQQRYDHMLEAAEEMEGYQT